MMYVVGVNIDVVANYTEWEKEIQQQHLSDHQQHILEKHNQKTTEKKQQPQLT